MIATLEQLREEASKEGVGEEILRLLARIVSSTALQYPAALYSKTQSWDQDSLDDLLHDWLEQRLLRRQDLAAMLSVAPEIGILRKMLTRSLSQFIINQRRRTSATNLFKRTHSMLLTDGRFRQVGTFAKASNQLWTLAEGGSEQPSEANAGSLVAAISDLSDDALEVVRYGPYTLKSSPILRKEALGRFLQHLLGHADGALTLAQIAEVLRRRFNLDESESGRLDDAIDSAEVALATKVEIDDLASSVIANLGIERIDALTEFHRSDGSLSATSKALGVSQARASQLVRSTMALVAEFADSFDEARSVYERIVESLF